MIVQEVFGFVKRDGPAEVVRSEAEEVQRGLGVQGKGAAAPFPLPPRCRRDEWVSLIIVSWTDWVRVRLFSLVITRESVYAERNHQDEEAKCVSWANSGDACCGCRAVALYMGGASPDGKLVPVRPEVYCGMTGGGT